MAIKLWFEGLLKNLGTSAKGAIKVAEDSGLTDKVMSDALVWVRIAANKEMESPAKQAFVANILTSRGVPKDIANLAIELAVQLVKLELAKVK